jgi:competence protein ComGF
VAVWATQRAFLLKLVTIDDPSILESLTAQYKKSFHARLQQQQQVDILVFTCQMFVEAKY